MLLLMLMACGSEPTAEETKTIVVKEPAATALDSAALPADTVTDTTPVTPVTPPSSTPRQEPPKQKPKQPVRTQQPSTAPATEPQPAATPPQPATTGLREGVYQLTRVQEESLPLVLDMTSDCDTKLLRGELVLREGQFQFQSFVTEECAGQQGAAERQEAAGTYRLEGNTIFLTVRTGEVLGDARGIISGTSIRLQQISNADEQQEVDWLFQLQ